MAQHKWKIVSDGSSQYTYINEEGYGFDFYGNWIDNLGELSTFKAKRDVTQKEVHEALKEEAKRRYKSGEMVCGSAIGEPFDYSCAQIDWNNGFNGETDTWYDEGADELYIATGHKAGLCIYCKGDWASIFDQHKIQKEQEAEEKARKYGESNIAQDVIRNFTLAIIQDKRFSDVPVSAVRELAESMAERYGCRKDFNGINDIFTNK